MKRILFIVCLMLGLQTLSAQIIQVETKTTTVDTTFLPPVEPPAPEPPKPKKKINLVKHPIPKGWRGFAEAAMSINFGTYDPSLGLDLLVTYGYQVTTWFYAGAGGGLLGTAGHLWDQTLSHRYDPQKVAYRDYHYTMIMSLPLYGNVRFYCLPTIVKPYFDIKMGAMIPLHSRQVDYGGEVWGNNGSIEYDEKYNRHGGLYTQFGLGVEYKQYSFSVNYSIRNYRRVYHKDDQVVYLSRGTNASIMTFNLGYNF